MNVFFAFFLPILAIIMFNEDHAIMTMTIFGESHYEINVFLQNKLATIIGTPRFF